jgi:outer membrane biosynthesis protein TonB
VLLRLLIGANGSVQQVKVLTGNRVLAKASTNTVRRWRYRPLEVDGRPVEAEANIAIRFSGDDAVSIDFRR